MKKVLLTTDSILKYMQKLALYTMILLYQRLLEQKKGNLYLLTLIENNFSSSRQSVKEFENTIINMIYSAL